VVAELLDLVGVGRVSHVLLESSSADLADAGSKH
jgi:hypothetical protein